MLQSSSSTRTFLDWEPSLSTTAVIAVAVACVLIWLVLRAGWGRSLVPRRWGWLALRAISLGCIVLILLGPTFVNQQAGRVTRPKMVMLVDGSQSMSLGGETTRWQDGLSFLSRANRQAGIDVAGDCQWFRFGHRLQPLAKVGVAIDDATLTKVSADPSGADDDVIPPPDASDSRLADAIRQLIPQVSGGQAAGVVLVSDGRVRGTETVEQLAQSLADAKVPLHVLPVGQSSGIGDVAIVSLVVPDRVRKFTENEMQVFLRSFGYTGQRTTVRIVSRDRPATDEATIASVPITLADGPQSVSLPFRVGQKAEDLMVIVDPVESELTERNNQVASRVEIDRTKIRVLYVDEGTTRSPSFFSSVLGFGGGSDADDLTVTVQSVLHADEDIECIAMAAPGGAPPRAINTANGSDTTMSFPSSRAELFAYDCIVLSGVGPNVLDEQQCEWISQWIQGRGGGLIVAGSGSMKPADWSDNPLLAMLPLDLENVENGFARSSDVDVLMPQHPIWQLQLEQRLNDQLLAKLPKLTISADGFRAKPSGEVLAIRDEDQAPVLVAHRVGRGRVIAATADIGGRALQGLADTWGEQPDRIAGKFWRNLIYWATEGASTGRRRLIADSDKRFYRPGDSLHVSAAAYDENAAATQQYRVWAMFEPASLDDMSLYSPVLWPDNAPRTSGEVGPRLAWGEELPLTRRADGSGYQMDLMLSETGGGGDSGMRIEMTAYEGRDSGDLFDHGTQVDSTSLAVQMLSDPFEQQNPMPNHDLLLRLASVSGGSVLQSPADLVSLLRDRVETTGPPSRRSSPAWSTWWMWCLLIISLATEWAWRRLAGYA